MEESFSTNFVHSNYVNFYQVKKCTFSGHHFHIFCSWFLLEFFLQYFIFRTEYFYKLSPFPIVNHWIHISSLLVLFFLKIFVLYLCEYSEKLHFRQFSLIVDLFLRNDGSPISFVPHYCRNLEWAWTVIFHFSFSFLKNWSAKAPISRKIKIHPIFFLYTRK